MKVLVIGSGGREHAICWKLKQSPSVTELYCIPGNAGTAEVATNINLSVNNLGALALWAAETKIDLTIVGPEAPLAEGIVDLFTEHGLRIFGPSKEAARLESSKSFTKEVLLRAGVSTAKAEVFDDFEKAKAYVLAEGVPIVIKADGLAAGKGVTVALTLEQAISALEEAMKGLRFGEGGKKVIVEEFIKGREASVIAIIDGSTVLPLVISQDYKRVFDEDEGPNTGGMGALSPTPVLSDKSVENLVGKIFMPVLEELRNRNIKYVGFLYAGIIVDAERNAKVLEFNCRLGDPETQVLMMRLKSDLFEILNAAVDGKLSSMDMRWSSETAVCVVACSEGYPANVNDGKLIEGLSDSSVDDIVVFHSGTTKGSDGQTITKGGRVLCITALGRNSEVARNKVYSKLSRIKFDGMHYRKDIGVK